MKHGAFLLQDPFVTKLLLLELNVTLENIVVQPRGGMTFSVPPCKQYDERKNLQNRGDWEDEEYTPADVLDKERVMYSAYGSVRARLSVCLFLPAMSVHLNEWMSEWVYVERSEPQAKGPSERNDPINAT